MSVSAGTVYVDVKPDTSAMSGKSSTMASAMKTAGIVAAGAFAVSFAKGAYSEAAEAQKAGLAFTASFEKGTENFNADKLMEHFDKINNAMGVSDEELQVWATHLNDAGDFTEFGKNADGMLKSMTSLIPNLAAASGKSTSMVEKSIKTLLTAPESAGTALRKLGALNDDQLKHYDKLVEAGKTVEAQEYAVAKATKNVGDRAAETTTPSERMSIAWAELQETVGTALMPVLNDLFSRLEGLVKWITSGTTSSKVFLGVIGALAAALIAAKVATLAQTAATNIAKGATIAWGAAQKVATAAQWAWNAAMSANPIGLIIAAIVALVAVVVLLWKKNEGFRNFVLAAWAKIKSFIVAVWNAIKVAGVAVWNFIKKAASVWWTGVKAYINAFKIVFTAIFNVVKKVASVVWNAIKAYAQSWWAAVRVVFGAFKAFFSAVFNGVKAVAQNVWNGIKSVVTGAWDGIKAAWNGAKSFFTGIWDGVESAAKGVFNGIASAWNSTVGSISFSIPDWVPKIGGNTFSIPDIPMLAEGGIAMSPTLAMIGERGPEAVVPLSGGGMTVRIVDSNLGLVMEGQLSTDRRYAESRGRANR